jgi:hypothetical protein
MKDWLRSLLIPPKAEAPIRRKRARAVPAATQTAPGDRAKTTPAVNGAAKGAPAQQDWNKALDGRQTATILREMIRMKLKDPDYAKRFAEGLKSILRSEDKER